MAWGVWFGQLPRLVSDRLYPFLRYTNLMRAVEMRYLRPWATGSEGLNVLDVGCGHGLYSLAFARDGACLLGCDLSSPALQAAQQTADSLGLEGRTSYALADAARLPVRPGAFDLVVCNCVLEHVLDDQQALAGMLRALRPGGLLYLTVDSADHDLVLGFVERLSPKAKARWLRPEIAGAPTVAQGLDGYLAHTYDVQRRYCHGDLETTLAHLGFEVLEWRAYLSHLAAAHYEIFHLLRNVNPQHGWGRLAYMVSSLLLYPFVVLVDDPRRQRGYGLVFVARKASSGGRHG